VNEIVTELDPESVRRANEQLLQSLGVVINAALPGIEGPNELQPRSADEVGQRAVVLGYIIGIGFRQPGTRLLAALQQYGLYEATTPEERRLLNSNAPTRQEQINCTWLTECVQALAWCMGLVGLDLQRRCDDDLGPRFPIFKEPQPFIATAKLRPFEEIYRMADLHYRAHWACRDAQLNHLASPLNEGVVKERRRALDWVIGVPYKWDEIPLDT
jgi:hypothetical protein